MATPRFITKAMALVIHRDQVDRYGGSRGVRDEGLLESALAMPSAQFRGQFMHAFPHEMAAAYLFHLAKNHPFVDGNKRVALATALVFLRLNGASFTADLKELEAFVIDVASGVKGKTDAIAFFSQRCRVNHP